MRIADLSGRRVALWGWGHEGHAAYRALRARLPELPLTLFCNPVEAGQAAALGDARLSIETAVDGERLAQFDCVVKSPGISPNTPEAVLATQRGTCFIGGTALWFAERAQDDTMTRTACVTGTKGKSTTSSLLAYLLRAAGLRTALAGNIGVPLLDLLDDRADAWVIELSSYQTSDVAVSGAHPQVAIVTNLHPEHLDWHGSEQRYYADKLALVTAARPRVAVLNAADPLLAALRLPDSEIRWYGDARGWHLRGDALYHRDAFVMDTAAMPLPGRHNRSNLCAVLTALEAFGLDAVALAPRAAGFQPLPNRLQPLGERDGVLYVNDSISTTPMATLAALELYVDRPVVVLVGGHDRGLPWEEFAEAMRAHAPKAVVTMGQNGPRIHDLLAPLAGRSGFLLEAAADLSDAVAKARAALPEGGVVLLSPGAPSFGPYRNYIERGRHFAQLAGFDPDAISGIAGMGIA
ncbi:UDP-N-acetylmuramoyl-L-alanine--D-glutamate ligase [Thermomonas sp.]|uniref:UDP-N-acetylmuramoyl-L-alanine--D-glutamate ligase n=1 Tax=Thermomonas sp. TaxID=1971895 RepID=UPI00263A1910|nr:UDP-N-acetylmuramoyl-L-alanine--D-glutamate ligase [Thermomonas sp.]